MSKEKENPVLLLKRILEISEKESKEIEENNLDKLEHYGSLRNDIMRTLGDLGKSESWISNVSNPAEVESILRKIDEVNNSNKKAVREKRDKIMGQKSDQNKKYIAINAYKKLS